MDNTNDWSRQTNRRERIAVLAILLVILFLFVFFLKNIMVPLIRLQLQHDLEGATALLLDRGLQGAMSVTLIEALQMVVIFVPAEFIQISSGLSYPLYLSLPLCDLGVCLGATIIFALVRVFKVQSAAIGKQRGRIERISADLDERNTVLLLYLLFFMPIIPFGAICYYGSSTEISYRRYILTVATGVIPSILVSNLMGEAGTAFLVHSLPLGLLILVIVLLAALLFVLIGFFIHRLCFRGTEQTPDSMAYAFSMFISRLWLGRQQKPVIDDDLLRGVEAPYILLVNHESFEDYYYVSQLAHPRNPTFLVNEYYCTRPILKTLAKQSGLLSKKLFTPDLSSGIGILRMIRKGFPIVIFPEGRLSPDGRSNPIVENGAALYRKLKTDLVLVRIDGAYYAHPKWRKKKYRSDIRITVRRVLPGQQLREMDDETIERLITEELFNDASARTDAVYPQKDKAVGLEKLLYRCADCGTLYQTVGIGNELVCRACGRRHRLDESYHFTDAPWSIPGYYDRIRRMEREQLDHLSLHASVRTKIFAAGGGPVRKERGECTLDRAFFRYCSPSGEFAIPVEKLPALAFSCGKEFELYHKDELHYFYPLRDPNQVARWALVVDLLAEKRRNDKETKKA